MVKIAIYKRDDGALLSIFKCVNGDLIGEVYNNGVEKKGKWDMRARFRVKDNDAYEYRVCEYFNFKVENSYWRKWG